MQRFDILDPKLDIFQNRFLEASAGTGKTFAIEHLVIRMLLEGEAPFALSEILAVTFTREATHEMKARIQSKLEELLPEGNPRVRRALSQFDEIQIFTIHGFCHRMLTEFAFEAKAPLKTSGPTTSAHTVEMQKTVRDFIRTGEQEYAVDLGALLKRACYDVEKLVQQIVKKVEEGGKPRPYKLPALGPVSAEKIWDEIQQLAPKYKRLKFSLFKPQAELLAEYLQRGRLEILLDVKPWFFEKLNESEGLVGTLKKQLLPELCIFRDSDQMLLRVAEACRKRWEAKAARQDHQTYDDFLHNMRKAIAIPPFKERVQSRYKAVIVDEFQDTDPVQWEIFKELFADNHLLYLVGDPKQSIYGFRNADIYTYMDAAKTINNTAYLDTNFRSSPQLIESLNALFQKNPDWISLPSMPKALQYHPVKAGRKEQKLSGDPIVFFEVAGRPGRERSWPTKKMEEEQIFPFVASELITLRKKIPFSQMALLVKDRFQGQRLQIHLEKWSIPSILKRTRDLTESRGFHALRDLLKAVAQPDNPRLSKTALAGPLFSSNVPPFRKLRHTFDEKGFSSLFHQFAFEFFDGDMTLYPEIRQTAEILMQEQKASLFELLFCLDQLQETGPELDPRLKYRGEDGEDRVPIMTTFASKGLEFDAVFALGMASRHNGVAYDEEKEAEKMRQLYVAFTRPKERLYVPILKDLSQKPPAPGCASPIELFFCGNWPDAKPKCPASIHPYQSERERLPLVCPKPVSLDFAIERLTSFTAMAKPHVATLLGENFRKQNLLEKTRHTLPLGAETGVVIHTLFETLFEKKFQPVEQTVCETLIGTHLEGWEEVLVDMAKDVLEMPLFEGFALVDLEEGDFFQEMEFLFPKEGQLVKGFADLVFKKGEMFYLLDWKTNWLGPSDADYTEEKLHKAMEEHDYYLQARLYAEAVQRYVKRFYINPQFGGAFYVFLRGKKAVHIGNS